MTGILSEEEEEEEEEEILADIEGNPVGVWDTEVILALLVGEPDALEARIPVIELLLANVVGKPEGFDVTGSPVDELFVKIVGNPDGTVELRGEAVLTLWIEFGLTVLLVMVELLERLAVGVTLVVLFVVLFVVEFAGPLIRTALMVRSSVKGS